MKTNNTNIEYLLLVRSALQFKEDLIEISEILDSLSSEQVIVVSSYMSSIKEKINYIENEFAKKFLKD
jgi:hypothetical protein